MTDSVHDLLSFEDVLVVVDEMGLVIRDPGSLASAVGRPAATVFGEDAYPDLPTKVAALVESVSGNQALVDGNKRLAWVLAVLTFELNGRRLAARPDDVVAVMVAIAEHRLSITGLAAWLAQHLDVTE